MPLSTPRNRLLTFVMVIVTIALCFGGAFLYDVLSGGPDARAAALASERLLTFQQASLDRTLCVSEITTRREIAKAEAASAQAALFVFVINHSGREIDPANERLAHLKGRLHQAERDLEAALDETRNQTELCPTPEPPDWP